MKLYAFHAGGEEADVAAFDPFDPQVGTKVESPFFFYLVEHPSGPVLFDCGVHPLFAKDPEARLGFAVEGLKLNVGEDDDVVSKLREVGVAPDDVRHVVLSHLHYDHAGGIEFFPGARFYVHRRELEFARAPAVYQKALYVPADLDAPVEWTQLDGEHDLFGDGRIVIFPTPGHSPGHQSMLVRLPTQNVILVADAAVPRNLELSVLPAIVWNPDAMVASWDRIRALRAELDAELIFTHDLDWAAKTRVAPDAWYA